MKKTLIMMCALCILSSCAIAADTANTGVNEGIKKDRPSKEEMMKIKKAREAAHQQMKPIMEQIFAKKKEAEMVKLSRIATWAQEEKLAELDKEIQELEKQANVIRKKNMKDFESILTRDQRKILKQMKNEGRKNYEQNKKLCPPPCKTEE